MKPHLFIIAFLSTLCSAHAQNSLVKFDSAKRDGNVVFDIGKITRTQANGYIVSVHYTNVSNRTLYAYSKAIAYNDVSDFGRYAYQKVAIHPKQRGHYDIELRLWHRLHIEHGGDLQFFDDGGKVIETYRLEMRGKVCDSLLPVQTGDFLTFSKPRFDSLHDIYVGRLDEKQLESGQLKVKIRNASPYTIVVKNKKRWRVKSDVLEEKDTILRNTFVSSRKELPGDTLRPFKTGYLLITLKNDEGLNEFRRIPLDTLHYEVIDDGGVIERRIVPYGIAADFEGNQFEILELPGRKAIFDYCNRNRTVKPAFVPNDSMDFRAIVIKNISDQEFHLTLPRNPKDDHTGFRFFADFPCGFASSFTMQQFVNTVVLREKDITVAPHYSVVIMHGIYGPMLRSKDSWSRTIITINGKKIKFADFIRPLKRFKAD